MSKHTQNDSEELGDFTATARVIPISLLAIGIGIVSTFVAWALLRLIGILHQCLLLRASEHRRLSRRRETTSAGSPCWSR